jgi:hypothetical protein
VRLLGKAVAAGLGGMLVLAVALGSAAPAVAAADPCGHANALLKAGDYASAYAAYTLEVPSDAGCARPGMAAAGALRAAAQLVSVGLVTDADAEIVRAVNADPVLTLPTSLLTTAGAAQAVTLAETLDHDGFHQQALQVLLFLTETHSPAAQDPAAQRILSPPGEPWWESWLHDIVSFVFSVDGGVLLIIAVIAVATYLPLTRRRLHLQPFTLESADLGADAEHFRHQVRDELQRLALEHARTDTGDKLRIDIAGPYDDPQDIGSVVDPAPWMLKFIGAVIGYLISRNPELCRPRLVMGALRADISVRMAIATVDKTEQLSAKIEHRGLGFPPVSPSAANPVAARYGQLALPAAAWVILNRYGKATLGGTRNLDSFVKFAVGCAWQEQDAWDEAEQFYAEARAADPRNTAAAVNLARLWQQREILGDAPVGADSRAIDLLHWVTDATAADTTDLQWYRSRYLLSRSLADGERDGQGSGEAELREQARSFAVDLAIEVMEQLQDPDAEVPREFLENSQGPALALAVSQMIPSTEFKDEVVTIGFVPDDITEHDVLWELRKARDGGSVAPEILVPYIEACPPDAEVDYNLYRYQLQRRHACEEAIAALKEELGEFYEAVPDEAASAGEFHRPDGNGGGDGEALYREQPDERMLQLWDLLEEAEDAAGNASAAADRYAERLSRSPDPVLQARVGALIEAERSYEESADPEWRQPQPGESTYTNWSPGLPDDDVREHDRYSGTVTDDAAGSAEPAESAWPEEFSGDLDEDRPNANGLVRPAPGDVSEGWPTDVGDNWQTGLRPESPTGADGDLVEDVPEGAPDVVREAEPTASLGSQNGAFPYPYPAPPVAPTPVEPAWRGADLAPPATPKAPVRDIREQVGRHPADVREDASPPAPDVREYAGRHAGQISEDADGHAPGPAAHLHDIREVDDGEPAPAAQPAEPETDLAREDPAPPPASAPPESDTAALSAAAASPAPALPASAPPASSATDQPEAPATDQPTPPATEPTEPTEPPTADQPEPPASDQPEPPAADHPDPPATDQPEVPPNDEPVPPATEQPEPPASHETRHDIREVEDPAVIATAGSQPMAPDHPQESPAVSTSDTLG